ncbi:MAG: geranylgeranyl reductase family protein [Deltaproteobacteria bacterium]|nr:geranylgeranyl reductase family protein [Deltaproteobacteria bacterium]
MKADFSVMVVGLGPAGAAAAVELARAGARVLVLEARLGREKPCGGCLSRRGVEALGFLDPPAWLTAWPVETLWLTAPGQEPLCSRAGEPAAWFVQRPRLDAWLAERAAQAGAEIRQAKVTRVTSQTGSFRVATDRGTWQAAWLVGADGALGRVGRDLGLGRTGHVFAALVEERPLPGRLAGLLAGAALIELGSAPGGYGWAFGRGDTLNLGLAGRTGRRGALPQGLHRPYARFLARHGLGQPGRVRGALIPCPPGRRGVVQRGRALVVGDAAGLADPFLGEGIAPAVYSGRLAARAILAGNPERYPAELADTLWRDHAHAARLAWLTFGWPTLFQGLARRHPGGLELGWDILRGAVQPTGVWAALVRGLVGRPWPLDPRGGSYYSNPLS